MFNYQRMDYFTHIKRAVDNMLIRVTGDACEGFLDLQPLFFLLNLDVTTAAALGQSSDSLQDKGGKIESQFARAFDKGQHYLAIRGRLGDFYWVVGGKEFRDACSFVHGFGEQDCSRHFRPLNGAGRGECGDAKSIDSNVERIHKSQPSKSNLKNQLSPPFCEGSSTRDDIALGPSDMNTERER